MGDLDLIRGASLYKENRFPTLTWYNSCNGAALLRAGGTKEERCVGLYFLSKGLHF